MSYGAMNSAALWANGFIEYPVIGYRVTISADAAPWYAAIAGCCLALAVAVSGFWLIHHRTLTTLAGRLMMLVVTGCVSVGWVALRLWHHSGKDELLPLNGAWDFMLALPWLWGGLLGVLLFLGAVHASPQRQRCIVAGLLGAAVGYVLWIIAGSLEDRPFARIRAFVSNMTAGNEGWDYGSNAWVVWVFLLLFVAGGAATGAVMGRRVRTQSPGPLVPSR
jgi:hypothetical protein